MTALARPLVLWDGACSFCRRWIERAAHLVGDRVEFATYQDAAARIPEVSPDQCVRAVHLVEPLADGRLRVTRAAEAVFRTLAYAPGAAGSHAWPLALYRHLPGFAPVSEAVYRWVADHRPFCDRLTTWIWGPHVVPPGERRTAWLFLRALGLVFLLAFVSLWVQALGLFGHDGILPAADFLAAVRSRYGPIRLWLLPTVAWAGAGDGALQAMCAIGTVCALLLAIGIAPAASLFGCWALYLSLTNVAREFCFFQWDALLLETGLLALFLAPWVAWSRPGRDPPPSRLAWWAMRGLLFRLYVSSAVVKLTSGDPNWRHLTALEYHYQTQCLPPWVAWYFHHLPPAFHRASAAGMFAIEGLLPFLILAPRRIRFAAAWGMIGLQLMIGLTGNYGYFNLLSIVLCFTMFDDAVWPWRWRRFHATGSAAAAAPRTDEVPGRWPRWVLRPALIVLLVTSLVPLAGTLRVPVGWLGPLPTLDQFLSPLRSVNAYGLFAVMTTRRLEIVLEASDDGSTWRELPFRWKPGDPTRRPEFVAPHMPRLDWQMWFAALGDSRSQPWFFAFCERLLAGSPAVRALMAPAAARAAPPRYLRALVYDYRFTDAATRHATGAWWQRSLLGLYCPVMTLSEGHLAPAPAGVGLVPPAGAGPMPPAR